MGFRRMDGSRLLEMPRYTFRYPQQADPAEQARKQASSRIAQQRQIQASAYAEAKFQEWQSGSQDREALMNARLQKAQSEAELKGAQFKYNFWKDNELRRQTTAYYTAMPVLQEQLKQAGIYPGSQRYAAEISAFAAELPDAVTHNEAIRKDLQGYAKVDQDAARLQQMMTKNGLTKQQAQMQTKQADLQASGFQPTSLDITSRGDINVRGRASNAPDIEKELHTGHGITRTQFETFDPNSAYLGKLDEKGNLNKNPSGTDIQFTVVKDGKASPVSMTVPEFNRYKEAFGMQPVQPQSAPQGTPTPAPVSAPVPAQQPAMRRYNPETQELE
jgi:hypothetical protein